MLGISDGLIFNLMIHRHRTGLQRLDKLGLDVATAPHTPHSSQVTFTLIDIKFSFMRGR